MNRRFVCPACEIGELRPDLFLVRCSECGYALSREFFLTLGQSGRSLKRPTRERAAGDPEKGASYGRGGERSKEGRSSFETEGTRNLAPLANRDREKGVFAPVVVRGLGWMWVGYALLSQRKETAAELRLAVR